MWPVADIQKQLFSFISNFIINKPKVLFFRDLNNKYCKTLKSKCRPQNICSILTRFLIDNTIRIIIQHTANGRIDTVACFSRLTSILGRLIGCDVSCLKKSGNRSILKRGVIIGPSRMFAQRNTVIAVYYKGQIT